LSEFARRGQPAGEQGAAGPHYKDSRRDAAVTAADQPIRRLAQYWRCGVVLVAHGEDEALQGAGRVAPVTVAGNLGEFIGLPTKAPCTVDIGVQPAQGGEGETAGPQAIVAQLRGKSEPAVGSVEIEWCRGVRYLRVPGEEPGL
jgi:hypothetical protein